MLLTLLLACGTEEGPQGGGDTGVSCPVSVYYESPDAEGASVIGSFNFWDPEANPMVPAGDGRFVAELSLAPGAYPYAFIHEIEWSQGAYQGQTCDPNADLIWCPEDYKEPSDIGFANVCEPDASSCTSLLVVDDCTLPEVEVMRWEVGPQALSAELAVSQGLDPIDEITVVLDGEALEVPPEDGRVVLDLPLDEGHHQLEAWVTDTKGRESQRVSIPFWNDGFDWSDAVMYQIMVDRFADGDGQADSAGTSVAITDFLGGDWQGAEAALDYLEDLGVDVLWITNPQSNTAGAWDGDCDETASGYHGYWPDHPTDLNERFGGEAAFQAFVDAAHGRGMRIMMDWVGNHVHSDHPYVTDHPEWFGQALVCRDESGGQSNWDRIPETCWFADYLPDIDYTQPEVLVHMADEAVGWAQRYGLDGLRIDAVKHMPHSVQVNVESNIQRRLEMQHLGGADTFLTLGETFDGEERITSYIGDDQLDGQFDFPLYYALREAFAEDSRTLPDLLARAEELEEVYGDAPMGLFLGNHDVVRFTTQVDEGELAACRDDVLHTAQPASDRALRRLRLAWTFLMTRPGIPLVYYGDEIGLEGYGDPDNRKPLWERFDPASTASVDDAAQSLEGEQAATLQHVQKLIALRRAHPALRAGNATVWWEADDVLGMALVEGDDQALVLINRSNQAVTMDNGLSWAGLSAGTWTDGLSGEMFSSSGDELSVPVGAETARVLVLE